MSKTLKPGDRKGIVITNDAPMNVYGGVRGPITTVYYETVERIAAILSDQVKVAQVTSKGEKIDLDFTNFDKDLDPYDDEIDEVLELINCTPDKIVNLLVEKTSTITTDVEACEFESLNTEIATVTPEGLVTAIKAGETSIRVSKEGYRTVSVPVSVVDKPVVECVPSKVTGLIVGQTIQLTATPEEATFESLNQEIATVTPQGLVEAISQGKATIVVSAEGYTSTEVTVVTQNKPVIKCTPENVELLYVGDTCKVETEPTGTSFRSENTEYATVEEDGTIKGVKAGNVNIIVSKEGYQDATVAVTLKDKLEIEATPLSIPQLFVGEEIKITTDPNVVEFKSEEPKFATVDANGTVRGIRVGSTNIVITKEGYKELKVPVTVSEKEEQEKGTITCMPQSIENLKIGSIESILTDPFGVTFRSENDACAKVTEAGVVTGVAEGTTNIIVSKEGYNDATVKVQVVGDPAIVCTPEEITVLYVEDETKITTEPTGASFRSEDTQYATVTSEGVVKGIKEGETNIVVTKKGYKDAKVRVVVKEKQHITCMPESIDSLKVGSIESILTDPFGVSFRSEDETYAKVTEAGVVTGVAEGTTNIIVSKEGYHDKTVAVTVVTE